MPNWFAIFALVSWPAVALYLYLTRPASEATLWTIMGARLLLPVGASVHFAGIPELDKEVSGNLGALLGMLLVLRRPLRFWKGLGVSEILLLTLLVSPFVTEELNTDPIGLANRIIPGGSHYDGLSAVIRQLLLLIPFFIGRQLLRSSSDIQAILRVLVTAGLFYSLPILFELHMSPVLHSLVYGYFPSSYVENVRDGGYRPVVFLGHGLAVAFFISTTVIAATVLWRSRIRLLSLPAAGVTGCLGVILILCKSLGPLLYASLSIPLVYLTSAKTQARVALVLVTLALCYPLLRLADVVPVRTMLETAATVSQDRADSLGTRLVNEERLLQHASSRIFFGWGRFGRNLVYDQYGSDISITDGEWIIVLGTFGLVGFLAEFGLLALAVYRAAQALRFTESPEDRNCLAGLTLILAISIFDLLPNSGLVSWTWLITGALIGRAESLAVTARERKKLSYLSPGRQPIKTLSTS